MISLHSFNFGSVGLGGGSKKLSTCISPPAFDRAKFENSETRQTDDLGSFLPCLRILACSLFAFGCRHQISVRKEGVDRRFLPNICLCACVCVARRALTDHVFSYVYTKGSMNSKDISPLPQPNSPGAGGGGGGGGGRKRCYMVKKRGKIRGLHDDLATECQIFV